MKIKNFVLIILFAGIVLTFSGCQNKSVSSSTLNVPNKINMYADGKQKQITKNGSKYDRSLFDRINVLVNIRMPRESSIIEGMMTQGIG